MFGLRFDDCYRGTLLRVREVDVKEIRFKDGPLVLETRRGGEIER